MRKICLISDHHISTNPRLWKEAGTLLKAGYNVEIITIFTSEAQLERDQLILNSIGNPSYKAVLNLMPSQSSFVKRFYYRLRRKLAFQLKKFLGIDSPFLLGYAPDLLERAALQLQAELYIVHIDCAQFVGMKLAEKGKRVAFDIEDWYSKDYLSNTRPVALLERIEKFALTKGAYCSVPSGAMAKAISSYYKINKEPLVIYNGFPEVSQAIETKPVKFSEKPSILWFSQTIGTDRGIETIVAALHQVETPVVLKLMGDHDTVLIDWFKSQFPFQKGHELVVSGQIPAKDLDMEIKRHDIGLAIENNFPENKNTTISNKILQYVQAGIQVIATATLGQLEVASLFPDQIAVVNSGDIDATAKAVEQLLKKQKPSKFEYQHKFKEHFSWESQETKLLAIIKNLFQ